MKKLLVLLNTPARVVIAVGLIVLGSEFLIMLLIENFLTILIKDSSLIKLVFEFLDPIVLTAIVSPALYLLIFRPLNQQAKLERQLDEITKRKQVEDKLAESERHFRAVTETANDAIITGTGAGNIVDWNAAAERLFGYTKAEIIGQPLTVLMPERFRNLHSEGLARVVAGGTPHLIGKTAEVFGLRKDGSEFPLELSLAQWQATDGQLFTAIIRDITSRKAAEEKINNLAFYDTLTQIPSRPLLNDRLEQAMVASKRSGHYVALMFLDLDNFKPLNDAHGHGVGDLLLIGAARRITSCVREVDTVARFGGDEFVVILSGLDVGKTESLAQASIVAEKIRAILAEPYLFKTQREGKAETTIEHRCTSSIGIVLFINHEASAEDILKWADTAMYQAKEAGRNLIRLYDSKVERQLGATSVH